MTSRRAKARSAELVITPARRLPDVEVPHNLGYIGCVSYHYLQRLDGFETPGIKKVYIEVLPPHLFDGPRFQNALGVLTGFAEMDLHACAALESKMDRKRRVLETLHSTMMMLAGERGWDKERLELAHHEVLADRLEYVASLLPEPIWNKSHTAKADARFALDLEGIRAFIVVTAVKEDASREIELLRMGPNLGRLRDRISTIRWIGDEQIQISSKPTYDSLEEANNVLLLGEPSAASAHEYGPGPDVRYEVGVARRPEGRRIHRLTVTV